MNKSLILIFIVVFALYVPFSRRPDFFDGLQTIATIHYKADSATGKLKPFADFSLDGNVHYSIRADYLFRNFKAGEQRTVIYENANPQGAVIYSLWGYWITWKELMACLVGYLVLFLAAKSIVSAPAPESRKELEDYAAKPKVRKSRYK